MEANAPCLRFIGAEPDQVLRKPFWEAQWWSQNANSVNDLKEAIKQGGRGQRSRFEVEHSDADGNKLDIAFILTPVTDENNDVTSLVIEFGETTASLSQKSLKHLRHAVSISGIGIWEWDMVSDQVIWDTRQFKLFGIQELKGTIPLSTVTNAIHPDDREHLNRVAQRVLEGGASALEEFRIIHPDGSIHWLQGGSNVIHTNGTESSAVLIGINMDITNRKEIEEAMRESESLLNISNRKLENRIAKSTEERAREAIKHEKTQLELAISRQHDSIGQLAGGVAHDFNNLLAVIGGNLEIVALADIKDEVRATVADALRAVEEGAILTQRLLTYARKQKLSPARLSARDCVLASVRLLERTLSENISITTVLEPNLWDVYADPGEIQSGLINLAVNARDAMLVGGNLTIEVCNVALGDKSTQLSADAAPGEYIGIFVTDTGSGMTIDVMHKAFEPFFTTKEPGKGTGLGLSSIYGFARESGGFMKLDSEVGKGTTVRLYLPRAANQDNSELTPLATLPTQYADEKIILVVEDNSLMRKLTVKRLGQLGYQVIEASTAQEAIDRLKTGISVDLVFTDVVMPGEMSGYDLSNWVSIYRKEVPVLLTSGYIDPVTHSLPSSVASINAILFKPYRLDLLAQRVRESMESHA